MEFTENLGKTQKELGIIVQQPRPGIIRKPDKTVPPSEWPLWARTMRQLSRPKDKGIGDVVERIVGPENSAAFKAFYKKTTGKDCGCSGRQKRWNILYPFD